MHYARYDSITGKITALYDDQINKVIPNEYCVSITDIEWQSFLADQAHWKMDIATEHMTYVASPELEYALDDIVTNKKEEIRRRCESEIENGAPTPFGFKVKCDTTDIAMFKGGIDFQIGCAAEQGLLNSLCTTEELGYIAAGVIPPNIYVSNDVNALSMSIKTLDAGVQTTTIGGAKYIYSQQVNTFNNVYRRKWELETTISGILTAYDNSEITETEAKQAILALDWEA